MIEKGLLTKIQGIYKITCKKSNNIYIGSSFDIAKRIIEHTDNLVSNTHHNYKIQNDFNRYGLDSFLFEIVLSGNYPNRNDLYMIEEGFINVHKPYYNIRQTTSVVDFKPKPKNKSRKKLAYDSDERPLRRKRRFASKTYKNHYAR